MQMKKKSDEIWIQKKHVGLYHTGEYGVTQSGEENLVILWL